MEADNGSFINAVWYPVIPVCVQPAEDDAHPAGGVTIPTPMKPFSLLSPRSFAVRWAYTEMDMAFAATKDKNSGVFTEKHRKSGAKLSGKLKKS